jgi:CubicO group peptidase (beta-lactamase class C family)
MSRHAGALSFLTVLSLCVAAAAPGSQDRATGGPPPEIRARIDAFVAAFNSGSAETFEAMAREHYAPALLARRTQADRAAFHRQMFAEFGRIAVGRITRRGPEAPLQLHATGATGATAVIALQLEPAAPFRIAAITVDDDGGPDTPAIAPPPIDARMAPQVLARALDAYLSKLADADALSGVVLVAKDGKPFFEKAYGFAERAFRVPNTPAMRFNLGSINKSFTQVAVAQLAAAGRLSYGDPLSTFIPDYPQEATRTATIEQLLGHTAGVSDFFGEDFSRAPKDRFRSNADYYRFVSSRPALFAPGARSQYCNGCYIVLGEIIERVSGVPYETYVAKHVFEPAGMKAAGFLQTDTVEANVAEGYTRRTPGGDLRRTVHMRGVAGSGAGGAYATAADLVAYDSALREHRLLDAARSARVLRQPRAAPGRLMGGYGIAGGAPGTSAVLDSDGTWTVIVLTNFDPPAGENVGVAIMKALGSS